MSSPRLEAFLARLYSDPAYRRRFLENPERCAGAADLDERERLAALEMDRVGLARAGRSYDAKRERYGTKQSAWSRVRAGFARVRRAARRLRL